MAYLPDIPCAEADDEVPGTELPLEQSDNLFPIGKEVHLPSTLLPEGTQEFGGYRGAGRLAGRIDIG